MAPAERQDMLGKYTAFWRGFRGSCPNCGKGGLFKSYLVQNDACPACGEDFSGIHADDGPGWFVMILTGAIIVPAAVSLSLHSDLPDWAVMTMLSVSAIVLVALILPRAKGLFIAVLWRLVKDKQAALPR